MARNTRSTAPSVVPPVVETPAEAPAAAPVETTPSVEEANAVFDRLLALFDGDVDQTAKVVVAMQDAKDAKAAERVLNHHAAVWRKAHPLDAKPPSEAEMSEAETKTAETAAQTAAEAAKPKATRQSQLDAPTSLKGGILRLLRANPDTWYTHAEIRKLCEFGDRPFRKTLWKMVHESGLILEDTKRARVAFRAAPVASSETAETAVETPAK